MRSEPGIALIEAVALESDGTLSIIKAPRWRPTASRGPVKPPHKDDRRLFQTRSPFSSTGPVLP